MRKEEGEKAGAGPIASSFRARDEPSKSIEGWTDRTLANKQGEQSSIRCVCTRYLFLEIALVGVRDLSIISPYPNDQNR